MVDFAEIYSGRNRTKRRFNDFMYEAMRSMMTKATGSASEFAFACCAMALQAKGRDVSFLTSSDRLIMQRIRVWITDKK
jgi:hypothetical protein